jgi:hypothetical protein
MQFSKTVSLFALFFLAVFGVVLAGPVDKRASVDASVFATLKTLQSSIASPLAHIGVWTPLFTSRLSFADLF